MPVFLFGRPSSKGWQHCRCWGFLMVSYCGCTGVSCSWGSSHSLAYISVCHYYAGGRSLSWDIPPWKAAPFAFDRVILNLLGMRDYDPQHAKVLKWDSRKNRLAGDPIAYIDDSRGCLAGPAASRLPDAVFGNARCPEKSGGTDSSPTS